VRDKTVRRRRALLALLVALSLILVSASFGGSGGALHTVQSGFLDVLSPVETVASKALTPVHDLIHWVDDVFHASSQRDALRRDLAAADKTIVALQSGAQAHSDAAKLRHLDSTLQLVPDGPVNANVIEQPNGLWVSNVTIDAGSAAGVRVNDPVIDPDGAIGTVSEVAPTSSVVTLLNDPSSGLAARDSTSRVFGLVVPEPGNAGALQMSNVSRPTRVSAGDLIVTAGEKTTQNASFFPAGVLIGKVISVSASSGAITVAPAADLTSLASVQVLTAVPRP
jgi:rod shape-determining protein MreC